MRSFLRVIFTTAMMLAVPVAHAEHVGANHAGALLEAGLMAYEPPETVSGVMTIAGSETMQPILVRIAQEFQRWHPDAKIIVQGETSGGARSLIDSLVDDIGAMRQGDGAIKGHLGSRHVKVLALSRDLTEQERGKFKNRYGYEPIEVAVAQDAIAVYVHADNPITGLTLEQVDGIFSKDRKRGAADPIVSWGQLGLGARWTQAGVHAYGRDKKSPGTRAFFRRQVLLDGEFSPAIREQPGSASVVLAVANDPQGIGYSGVGFAGTMVRQVPLAATEGDPYLLADRDTVSSGQYPLTRTLHLYVNKTPDKELAPLVREFLKFVNTQPAQAAVAKAGVYPLTAEQASSNLARLGELPIHAAVRTGTELVGQP